MGPYYIIHLYSGRRRPLDFHAATETMLARYPHLSVKVLSIDTAVDPSLNVHSPELWTFLLGVAAEGRVLGLLQGPLCETWTPARHHALIDDHGRERRGPRPLRTTDDLWGILRLSLAELEQISIGNILLLKDLVLACVVTLDGGATFLEHPAMPWDDSISSIWRLVIIRLLLRHPHGLFRRITAEQWRFGSCSVKPTTCLYSNTNLPLALGACIDRSAAQPTQHLIGRCNDGTFKTMRAKEYPGRLNQAFALVIANSISHWHLTSGPCHHEPYGLQLAVIPARTEYSSI